MNSENKATSRRPGPPRGSLAADPNPVPIATEHNLGATTISWSASGVDLVEVRVNSPNGLLFARSSPAGSSATGNWVYDGVTFYLLDVSGGRAPSHENTLAKLTVRTVLPDSGKPPAASRAAPAYEMLTPKRLRSSLERIFRGRSSRPPVGGIRFGDFKRVEPFSRVWGFDRGNPVDRYYVDQFLEGHAADIAGRVLEIGNDLYTQKYGDNHVTACDILDIDASNPHATLIGDLSKGDNLPSQAFDCIILTQTLQLIYDLRATVRTIHRILKAGGVVLATAPGITPTGDRAWGNLWCWSLTDRSVRLLFSECFEADSVEVVSYGNVLSATALLYGIAAEELEANELDHKDPSYCVTIGIRAVKRQENGE